MVQELIEAADRQLTTARAHLQEALRGEQTRRRGAINRQLWEVCRRLGEHHLFHSQAGQDLVVDRILKGKRDGVFADVGGYDGMTGSNTLFFEQYRGWTGILVEPAPTMLARARAVRRCTCLGVAVGSSPGPFMEVTAGFTQMSGFLDSYDPGLLAQVRADPRHREVVTEINAKPLAAIFDEAGLSRIDYVNLDVEGGERAALEGFPFDRHEVAIWTVENNVGEGAVAGIMQRAGYKLVEFVGQDEVWLREDLI